MLPLAAADSDSESERGRPEWRRHSGSVAIASTRAAAPRAEWVRAAKVPQAPQVVRLGQARHMARAHGNTPDPPGPPQKSRRLVSAKVRMV